MKKFLTVFFAIIILFTGCSNEQPVEVTTEKVRLLNGNLTLTHEGIISLSDETEIRATISGNVMEKYAAAGSDVTEGQKILKTSEIGAHTDLLQEKTELAKSMTELTKEMSELQQAEKNSSAQNIAAKKSAVETRQAEIAEMQERIQKMEDDSATGIVYAPKSGRLGAVDAPLGSQVTADETLLATIGNINPLAVRFEISPEEARLLSTAQDLKVTLKFIDGTIYPSDGTIKFLDDSTAETLFDNSDGLLLLGMTVKVELDGAKVSNTLLIPESAVQQRDDGNYIFVVDSNKEAALKKISLGGKLGTYFIVTDGLKSDDSVVVEGQTNLREGMPLKFQEVGNRN